MNRIDDFRTDRRRAVDWAPWFEMIGMEVDEASYLTSPKPAGKFSNKGSVASHLFVIPGSESNRRSASALLQYDAKLRVDGKMMEGRVKLGNNPIEAMAIKVDRLPNANLQRTLRAVVLGAEVEPATTSQY